MQEKSGRGRGEQDEDEDDSDGIPAGSDEEAHLGEIRHMVVVRRHRHQGAAATPEPPAKREGEGADLEIR